METKRTTTTTTTSSPSSSSSSWTWTSASLWLSVASVVLVLMGGLPGAVGAKTFTEAQLNATLQMQSSGCATSAYSVLSPFVGNSAPCDTLTNATVQAGFVTATSCTADEITAAVQALCDARAISGSILTVALCCLLNRALAKTR